MFLKVRPTGRKMDFLVQELNREVNTTGSKSQLWKSPNWW
ncbi:MAG: endoribonuclease YicC domain-containing protein [Ruminococcus callidus]